MKSQSALVSARDVPAQCGECAREIARSRVAIPPALTNL
jgi:hypothetical protein